jgi:L-seryl-tRNA(Ser) seleniumtransferase
MRAELQKLPSVDKLLQHNALSQLAELHGHRMLVESIRASLDEARRQILSGRTAPPANVLVQSILTALNGQTHPTLQSVINATGVVIHTNLGRAILSQRAIQAMTQAASGYSNLEYDLEAGRRGSRYNHAADLLCRLTGAEAAVVVNNNAGAVMLSLMALAKNTDVIISRGQLVEIGGGFRIPDIMTQSGARLVEVGTTNRTYTGDYEQAIRLDQTSMLLAVHHSNYHISGFTSQPSLAELNQLARRHNLLLMEDLGSGTLLDTAPFGLTHEPTIQESLTAGVDLVTASGDKLFGGPQAGLILGRADLIDQLKRHPFIRALRVDKTTLAGLQATLLAYLEDKAVAEIPVWRMIAADPIQLGRRARKWQETLLQTSAVSSESVQVVDSFSTVGGGSLPGQTLPTKVLAVAVDAPDKIAQQLRQVATPVITRIENNRLLFDPRTVLPEQDTPLLQTLQQLLSAA